MTRATVARALECFDRATTIDPGYALAWAGIADAYASRLFNSDARPSDVASEAWDAARKALEHGRAVAEAHTAVARMQFLFDWDWPASEATLRHAIRLDPGSGQSHWMLGHAISQQGRHAEARAAAQRARELDPFDALTLSMSAQIAYSARDMEAAARHAREALAAEPDFWVGHWQLGQAYQQLGRAGDALEALEEASRLSDGNSKPMSVSAYTFATIGRTSDARRILAALEERSRGRYVPPVAFALAHAGLDESARAIEWLEQAVATRDAHLIYVLMDPKWDPFRTHERFRALLRQAGL
jgi:tetratricopeptide (TPR) repeat protein